MEKRTMIQVKLFILCLNPMRDRMEARRPVILATSFEKLKEWYFEQKADKPYDDNGYYKEFKKDSELEWLNPLSDEGRNWGEVTSNGHGVFFDWFNMEESKNNGENKNVLLEEIQNKFGLKLNVLGL